MRLASRATATGAPNTPFQPTASRARSLLFERDSMQRSRQLNANPFGGFHLCTSIIINPLLCYTSTI